MIGRQSITIGARPDGFNDFVLGLTTSSDTDDGGFSPETTQVNIIAVPGVLNAPGAVTSRSTNLVDEIIASCEDPTYLGSDRLFLDDAGNFYTFNGTTLTLQATLSGDKVTLGTTDLVPFYDSSGGLFFYATTSAGANGNIIRWNKSSGLVEDWWTNASHRNQSALSSTTPWRPLLVYERMLFVGDKNKLHRVATDLTVSNGILALNDNEAVSALGIDNGSGKMLIATTSAADYSASRNGESTIYYYDGYSNKAIKACRVNGTVTSFLSVADTVYVFFGNKMGIFTGSGIRFLRQFNFAIGTAADLIYPHRRCVIDNTVYIAENSTVLAYGPLTQGGTNVFYPALAPDTSGADFTCLCSVGGNKLGYSYSSAQFYTHDLTSVAAVVSGGAIFRSKRYQFSRPVWIRSVDVEYYSPIAAGSENIGSVAIIDDQGNTVSQVVSQLSGSTQPIWRSTDYGIKTSYFALRYSNAPETASKAYGVRRFIVYYDPAE